MPPPKFAALSTPSFGLTRAPSLAEQAADVIVTGIYSGTLKPGERLYEAALTGILNMSRVPLSEALKILEAQGIVVSIPHKGSTIALFGEKRAGQIREARIALERIAVTAAAFRYRSDPTLAAGLDAIIARMESAALHLDWIGISRADLDFHREICSTSGNEIVVKLWESLARHVFIVFGLETRDRRDAALLAPQHRRLRNLLVSGDVAALHDEIARHITRLQPPRPPKA
jgi:DNA-binding GntR family transcriptional regulator